MDDTHGIATHWKMKGQLEWVSGLASRYSDGLGGVGATTLISTILDYYNQFSGMPRNARLHDNANGNARLRSEAATHGTLPSK